MRWVLAVLIMVLLSAAACTGSDDETAGTVSIDTTEPETTTTTETITTTTAEVETTTTIDPLSEEAVAALMDQYFSFVWDEPDLGHGHVARERDLLFTQPLLGRSQASMAERVTDNRFRRGTVTGDVLSIEVSGTSATVETCATDAVGLYEEDGTVVVQPDDFSLRLTYALEFTNDGWKISEFFLGAECQR